MILTEQYVNDVIRPALEGLFNYELSPAKRKIAMSSNGATSVMGVNSTFPTAKKVYWGNIIAELPISTSEYKIELFFNTTDSNLVAKRSGLVGLGYNGLAYIPFEMQNHLFSYMKLTRDAGDTTIGKYIFDGWEFTIK